MHSRITHVLTHSHSHLLAYSLNRMAPVFYARGSPLMGEYTIVSPDMRSVAAAVAAAVALRNIYKRHSLTHTHTNKQ
jgi:hypothetical protein